MWSKIVLTLKRVLARWFLYGVAGAARKEEMTNIQARFKNGKLWSDWRSLGDVRHVDAARAIAEAVGYDVIEVETRDESHPSVVFSHTVSRSVVYKIIPHRYDLSDDDD